MPPKGYLAIVLHAHLPYVRHPEYESFLEERWFFEAMTETYLPLLGMLDRLAAERVPFRITLSLSPTLLAMMEDELLLGRYRSHLVTSIELADKERERNRANGHFEWLARTYHGVFTGNLALFDSFDGRLTRGFARAYERGVLDLITCCATHAVLPLLSSEPKAIGAQIRTGVEEFERVFGFKPQGFWLPECAYAPGIETHLREQGIRYFFLESHGIDHASVVPLSGVYGPLFTPSGVAAFSRDRGSTEEVWSARKGFPGDPVYREFYRDIGHDLEFGYIKPYIEGSVRVDTGIKYWRITGRGAHKEPYDFHWAREKAARHAGVFLDRRVQQIEHLASGSVNPPIVVATFDAELFGHWWYEGPQWLEFLIRKSAYDQSVLGLESVPAYLDGYPAHQAGIPCMSSWGHQGTFEIWCNGKTDWIVAQSSECARRLTALVKAFGDAPSPLERRALNQCTRELLLAQSSDWPFIISNNTAVEYATRRVRDHVSRFHVLADAVERGGIDEQTLAAIEYLDGIFPGVDFAMFA